MKKETLNILTKDDFADFCTRIEVVLKKHYEALHQDLTSFPEFGRLSPAQEAAFCKRFRKYIGPDHVHRLVLAGRGKIAKWLAEREQALPASRIKMMPQEDLDKFNKDVPLFIMTEHGVEKKKPSQMSKPEHLRVVSEKTGRILPPEQQDFGLRNQPKTEASIATFQKISNNVLAIKSGNAKIRVDIRILGEILKKFDGAKVGQKIE